jgi:hypothetical protein
MNSTSQPISTYRGPSVKSLTVGAMRSILANIPKEFDSLPLLDSQQGALHVLCDEDWLNSKVSMTPPGVILKIR